MRPHALLGAATGLVAHDAAFGAGWSTFTPGAARACVARIDRRVTGEQQVCLRTPHDDMRRRRRESHGWRGLARSGRVVGPREGYGSLIDARLVALASINLGGSCHCKWASA